MSMASATAATLTPEAASPSTGGNPYTGAGAGDCNIHVAAFLGCLVASVLAVVLAGAVVYAVLYLVGRCHRRRVYDNIVSDPENPAPLTPLPSLSQLVYSAATTTLAADCAICLAEFADGDAIRVVPACRHGFHASCIQRWLAGGRRLSCPTCRAPAVQPDEATDYDDCARWLFIVIVAALQTAIGLAVFSPLCSSP